MSFVENMTAWVVLALAASLGGLSMLAFAVFLFAGPPSVIEFNLGRWGSAAMNTGLSLLFFVQHSGMVRQSFRRWLARFVAEHFIGAIYSIASGVVLLLLVLLWQETEQVIVAATGAMWWTVRALFVLAMIGVIWGVMSLDGFDSLGLTPIRNRFRTVEPMSSGLTVRGPYRWVRHPLYFFALLMIWSYPTLTTDRALFNVLWTVWIVIGTVFEERDLAAEFGEQYRVYQRNVPMLIPKWNGSRLSVFRK